MSQKTGGRSCVLGLILLVLSHFTGSFAWIARLLGYIVIANGAPAIAPDNRWFITAGKVSTIAVAVFAILQILQLTRIFTLPAQVGLLVQCVFAVAVVVCLVVGVLARKKEEHL